MKIAIVDTIGLCYDGNTLDKKGLGGSESAVILIAKNLQSIGFEVTVFNNCIDGSHSSPGTYDGVKYVDNSQVTNYEEEFDWVIVSRTVEPFVSNTHPFIHSARKRVLWLHDTFVQGDLIVEDLLVSGKIDHLFTLSDWHTNYILNADHGKRRNYEVLKKKVFQTRNGAVKHIKEVDVSKKDRNHFVYNASATKGLVPLVEKVWPKLKKYIPDARLTVIGGYYRFREGAAPDAQENTVAALSQSEELKNLGVTFTGVIRQSEIADILANAYMMIYPGAFPETFGISSLESLLYKTPIATSKFGALEETAILQACYQLDYAISPNVMFQHINEDEQVDKFVDMVVAAWNNPYLHQQKQNYCDVVSDIFGWDGVALQWKQFFYDMDGKFLNIEDYRKVNRLNEKVARIFGRVTNMPHKKVYTSYGKERRIVVISPFWNAKNYIENNIKSVASQDYENYIHVVIDDASDDGSEQTIQRLSHDRLIYRKQDKNMGAIRNLIEAFHFHVEKDDIVMLLDGDDWLVNNPTIFKYYNDLYDQGYEFTYGSMWSLADNIPLISQDYPSKVKTSRSYREHLFNWKIPYTHLRTFAGKHCKKLDLKAFKDADGKFMMSGADNPLFYQIIEKVSPEKIFCNKEIVCVYNDANPLNDYKIRGTEQNMNADMSYRKAEKFSVVIPTMFKVPDITWKLVNDLQNCEMVDEIILIDNSEGADTFANTEKLKVVKNEKNIYVNPSWNMGVTLSKNNKLCIVNDDLSFDVSVFSEVGDFVTKENGVIGLCPGVDDFNQPKSEKIEVREWNGEHTYGFGCLFFIHKENWFPIPNELKIYYGDNFVFENMQLHQKPNFIITGLEHHEKFANTTSDKNITEGFLERETDQYEIVMRRLTEMKNAPKKILIAIPTAKYIEVETFKSVYDLIIPEGYEVQFQYFYGYQIDQIRNLAAEWGKNYDYLFFVDSDIVLPTDALLKMIELDKPIVSGLYIQRKPDVKIPEVYMLHNDSVINIPIGMIENLGPVEIMACGMGCALIKGEVFRKVPYPHFYYKSAIDHKDTVSEDVYFCLKAREHGFATWCIPDIRCDHVGSTVFSVKDRVQQNIDHVHSQDMLPVSHVAYLEKLESNGKSPKVIYDIGSSVLHWHRHAKRVWPNSEVVCFDANTRVEGLYKRVGVPHHLGVLSDTTGKLLRFYDDPMNLGGNSYYKETTGAYSEDHAREVVAITLDDVVSQKGFPLPDMIKLDVQGAEVDILKGATKTLRNVKDIILEAQHVKYNDGAPLNTDVIEFMKTIGFELVSNFTSTDIDGDYHFRKSNT